MDDPAKTKSRLPHITLLPLILAVFVLAGFVDWQVLDGVDSRTYLEMVDGVARHGLPYTENGEADRFSELRARWNFPKHGVLWGKYQPLYAYAAAPFLILDGVPGVIKFNLVLLVFLILGVYYLSLSLGQSPKVSAVSAYLALLGTPVWFKYLEVSSSALMITLTPWAFVCAVESLKARRQSSIAGQAGLAGALSALCVSTHVLAFPMVSVIFLFFLLFPLYHHYTVGVVGNGSEWISGPLASKSYGLRWSVWGVGFVLCITPLSILNMYRFGTPNPLTYGPCIWRSCGSEGTDIESLSSILIDIAVPGFWALLLLLAVVCWRYRVGKLIFLGCLVVLVFSGDPLLRQPLYKMLRLGWNFVMDVRSLRDFYRPEDGLGFLYDSFAIKSLLQSSPFLALALLARSGRGTGSQALFLIGGGVAGLFAGLISRPDLLPDHALGYPQLHIRYIQPALPFLSVLAATVVGQLPWRRRHAFFLIVVTTAVTIWFLGESSDLDYVRRVVLLRVSLIVALGTVLVVVAAGRFPRISWLAEIRCFVLALAIGFSVAVSLGVDFKAGFVVRNRMQQKLERLAALTPERFGLLGWAREIDPVLSLKLTRDVRYADLWELWDWALAGRVVTSWFREDRPVYALFPEGSSFGSPWPRREFVLIDKDINLYLVRLKRPSLDAGK